jgi:hypothetical protein
MKKPTASDHAPDNSIRTQKDLLDHAARVIDPVAFSSPPSKNMLERQRKANSKAFRVIQQSQLTELAQVQAMRERGHPDADKVFRFLILHELGHLAFDKEDDDEE